MGKSLALSISLALLCACWAAAQIEGVCGAYCDGPAAGDSRGEGGHGLPSTSGASDPSASAQARRKRRIAQARFEHAGQAAELLAPQNEPPEPAVVSVGEISPRVGTRIFMTAPAVAERLYVPDVVSAISQVSMERLQAAASILAAAEGLSETDARFLADEAGRAMIGESVRVIVPLGKAWKRFERSENALAFKDAVIERAEAVSEASSARDNLSWHEAFMEQDRLRTPEAPRSPAPPPQPPRPAGPEAAELERAAAERREAHPALREDVEKAEERAEKALQRVEETLVQD